MSVNVAVVGATGAVGDLMRKVLVERAFPVKAIKFLASEKSAGKTVEFAGKPYTVELLRPEAFAGVQIVLSSTPGSVSKEYSPIAEARTLAPSPRTKYGTCAWRAVRMASARASAVSASK